MIRLIKISEEQIVTVKAVYCDFTVSATLDNDTTEFEITGISIIPQFLEVKSNDIRESIINKAQTDEGTDEIDRCTKEGTYFVNVRDYSSDEIQFLSKFVANQLLSEIWSVLIDSNHEPLTISITDEKARRIIIEENGHIFKDEHEFEVFCSKYGLSTKAFILPAKFSALDIKLKEIEARFELEQFFARRYLFCYTFIEKLTNRISEYNSNGNQIDRDNLNLVNLWIEKMNFKIETLKRYKDYYKLYDMPETESKIEIKNSNNINIIGGNLSDSKIKQKTANDKESKTSKHVAIWTVVLGIITLIVTIIINWDKIF
jgi:hypothetical protein